MHDENDQSAFVFETPVTGRPPRLTGDEHPSFSRNDENLFLSLRVRIRPVRRSMDYRAPLLADGKRAQVLWVRTPRLNAWARLKQNPAFTLLPSVSCASRREVFVC
jgi:hypothetical protein